VITDGYDSRQKFLSGVGARGLEQVGKLRIDAHLRDFYQGIKRSGPSRLQTYDKVNWDDRSCVEHFVTENDDIALYQQVLNHVQFQYTLQVVLGTDTKHNRRYGVITETAA